ncbi:hypothetical protein SAMN05421810_11222 [Amycolatopsis arida]|uniref:RibD C-terminal domain-containing protein n=1 Tax=Amycolatopsis arida TaxID=587909 RepID=A0A1I6AD39_9PSEU|nr:hypothetical protein CLV69_102748 [Amycolatopsis arida]SFQ66646.1 hypothetical protein SAMN05421810_11222 [Amycolatopsis arida]
MNDTKPQTTEGKVLRHFTMSLDGFVASPNHAMDWMVGTNRPGLEGEYVTTTGAVLGGRDGWDIAATSGGRPIRRRLGRTDLRAHPPPRRRETRRRSHLPRL